MINKKILFCTYDGLLDPLGQSQILPYVRIFKTFLSYVHILSFEKKKKYRSQNHKLSDDLNKINITHFLPINNKKLVERKNHE